MKRIALFSDGTGNSSASHQKTNVWRTYQALDCTDGSNQIAFYDNGVGTSSFTPIALVGQVFGWGLARNVRQIYGFLCRTYNPGDEIYCFGFSRGAFTIRVVAALIANQGIIDRKGKSEHEMHQLIIKAYRRFRKDNFTPSFLSFFGQPLRDWLSNRRFGASQVPYDPADNLRYLQPDVPDDLSALIKFIGVWDTVAAYGGPIGELTEAWDKVVWPLTAPDRDLSDRVERACHALAIDEQRKSFSPMLWNEQGRPNELTIAREKLSQVWFSGVHANIGGSYPDDTLAFTALNWILDESAKCGLRFLKQDRYYYHEQANPNGPLYDSRQGIANLYRYAPRHIKHLCDDNKPDLANWSKAWLPDQAIKSGWLSKIVENKVVISQPKIHHTVFARIARAGDGYAPINIPQDYAVVDASGKVTAHRSPAPAVATLPETAAQAVTRKQHQSLVWTKVWQRKLLHVATLIAIFAFILYPYTVSPMDTDGENGPETLFNMLESFLGTLSVPIQAIPEFLGAISGIGIVEDWAATYSEYSAEFMLFVGLIVLLLITSWRTNATMKSEMRSCWHHVTKAENAPPLPTGGFRNIFAGYLESDFRHDWVVWLWRCILASLAVVFFLTLLLAAASHAYFLAADGFGVVCKRNNDAKKLTQGGKTVDFVPTDTCFATGIKIEKDKRYTIAFQLPTVWKDKAIVSDINGWSDAPAYMYAFTPFRRHLFVDWYRPVIRINNRLFSRFAFIPANLKTDPYPNKNYSARIWHMKFTARRSGELFIYMNDAVLFSPNWPGNFYSNNSKIPAKVTITETGE